ncbi:translesion error-prone DNA polymerase V subunit UmuC [Pseudomonas luteola]
MSIFALIDCHCFYVSCERLFRPELRGKPVVSLSNNDGCVVSRSDEAKRLNIKMGQPYFQIEHLIRQSGLICCSSNYGLYQDISNRVMEIIRRNVPSQELYSIDESWADLSGVPDPEAFARMLQGEILRLTGIPVGIGIAQTKTLAKIANWASKRWKMQTGAVVDLRCVEKQRKLLMYADVDEVWGIGRQISKKLGYFNINKAWDLAEFDKKTLRKAFSVNIERTSRELSGEKCLDLVTDLEPKKMIACTRSFGERVTSLASLREAISSFVSRAAVKLRQQHQYACCIQVFIQTSRFDESGMPYARSATVSLSNPTCDTRDFLNAAMTALNQIYREGPRYAKAGIILSQFFDAGTFTDDLFSTPRRKHSEKLMAVLDAINTREGRGTVRFASEPYTPSWSMKRSLLSPNYTTDWNQVMRIIIDQ